VRLLLEVYELQALCKLVEQPGFPEEAEHLVLLLQLLLAQGEELEALERASRSQELLLSDEHFLRLVNNSNVRSSSETLRGCEVVRK